MPNKVSARKRVRQNERRRVRNRQKRSTMRTAVKKVEKLAETLEVQTIDAAVRDAQSKLGKAAKTKLIKKNAMARQQSRLMKAAAKAKAAAAAK